MRFNSGKKHFKKIKLKFHTIESCLEKNLATPAYFWLKEIFQPFHLHIHLNKNIIPILSETKYLITLIRKRKIVRQSGYIGQYSFDSYIQFY